MSNPRHLHFWSPHRSLRCLPPMHLTGLAANPALPPKLTGIPGAGGDSPTGLLLAHTLPLQSLHYLTPDLPAPAASASSSSISSAACERTLRKHQTMAGHHPQWHPSLNPSPRYRIDTSRLRPPRPTCHYSSSGLGDAFVPQWVQHTVVTTIETLQTQNGVSCPQRVLKSAPYACHHHAQTKPIRTEAPTRDNDNGSGRRPPTDKRTGAEGDTTTGTIAQRSSRPQ